MAVAPDEFTQEDSFLGRIKKNASGGSPKGKGKNKDEEDPQLRGVVRRPALEKKLESLVGPGGLARLVALEGVYDELMKAHVPMVGKALSHKEREKQGLLEIPSLVYGEIKFLPFALAITKIKATYKGLKLPNRPRGGVFVDAGSGMGKACFAACLLHEFDTIKGYELLKPLHRCANELIERWQEEIMDEAPPEAALTKFHRKAEIEFANVDFTTENWAEDADLVFVSSTCFDDDLMANIAEQCEQMKGGSFVITLTKKLPSDLFEVRDYERHEASWGAAIYYIQQKQLDETPEEEDEGAAAEEEEGAPDGEAAAAAAEGESEAAAGADDRAEAAPAAAEEEEEAAPPAEEEEGKA